jgi:hypothetical protein
MTDQSNRDERRIVVGRRGHGAFAGMLLGSVSRHCVQHAPCAVVVIPDDHSSRRLGRQR